MCGIVGVLGTHEVSPIILDALKRLEYRGYDSAGIATISNGTLARRRALGKLINLSDLLVHEPLPGKSGIGHTRWATHGAPSIANAHPHQAGRVAVVHNGIIENFRELRAALAAKGCNFQSDTDTETVALLFQDHLSAGLSPKEAARHTISALNGAFALCFLIEGEEDLLVVARKGSPLAIGHGKGEMYVGSDALALAPMTDRITYLEEGDWALITRAGAQIFDAEGQPVTRKIREIQRDALANDKGGYKHFMAKEIAEQPGVLADAIGHYVSADRRRIEIDASIDFTHASRLTMVACGTAFLACNVARYWFECLARLPVELDVASEFRYREPPLAADALALFVSQSGETADTLAALRYCSGKVAEVISVVNVAESTIARESDLALPIYAGLEIGVASTKAFTCQLTALFSLVVTAARQRGHISPEREAALVASLLSLPAIVTEALAIERKVQHIARSLAESRDILFLGRGQMYPLAMEGALKLKEISYIHAEGYPSGELKHGPIALVDKAVPVIVMAPRDALFDKTVSNMQEVMARGGRILLITDKAGAEAAGEGVWQTLILPDVDEILAPIIYAIPAQLLAYHTAVTKGTDVDQPRNLAKSVTVE